MEAAITICVTHVDFFTMTQGPEQAVFWTLDFLFPPSEELFPLSNSDA